MKARLSLAGLFICSLLSVTPLALAAFEAPSAPNGYVLDQASILSESTELTLNEKLGNFDQETSTQIVVVTLEDLQGYPIETASLEIGRTWGVGQEGSNNGLIFLIAPNDREMRIEVGYGLEGAITDLQSADIIDHIAAPRFRENNYDQGVLDATDALVTLASGEAFTMPTSSVNWEEAAFFLIWFLVTFAWALASWMSQTRSWWLGGVFGGIGGLIVSTVVGAYFWPILGTMVVLGLGLDYVLSTVLYKKIKSYVGHSSHRGGRGGFGGGSSGGFGGFGGGSFGGGGASGGW